MDIILCRNVLIYFDDETTRRVSARLLASLADDGVLILGASDPLLTDADGATASVSDAGLVYRRRLTGSPGSALSHAEPVVSVPPPIPAAPPPPTPSVAPLPPPLRPAAAPATTVEVAVASVLGAYASADYGAAALRARQALAKGADDTRLHILLVRALANQGRLTEANEGLTAAHATHRLSPELVYLEAVLHLEAGRPADAVEAARRAIYLDPAFVLAHLSLGDAFARLGRHADARRAWRNAERTLRALPPDAIVEASDGERADRLLAMVRARIALISTERA